MQIKLSLCNQNSNTLCYTKGLHKTNQRLQDIPVLGKKSTSPADEWWKAIPGWVGGGFAFIRAFTTHLNEWIFRAFRICILMEPAGLSAGLLLLF